MWKAVEIETKSMEIELKRTELTRRQLCGLLQATEENQSYASTLNRGVKENLEDVIVSNKRARENAEEMCEKDGIEKETVEPTGFETPTSLPLKKQRKKQEAGPHISFSTNTPHKPLLLKTTALSLASTIVPGLKTLMHSLEVQHPDIIEEIKYHSHEQIKLASLSESLVTWLRTVLTSTVDAFDAAMNMPLNDACEYDDKLRIIFRSTLIDFYVMVRYANNHTIERHASERKFLLERVSIPFKYVEYVFGLVTFHWVEKNMLFTKALQFVDDPDKPTTTYKVDALAIVKTNHREFATIEASGGPIEQDRSHTLGDTEKALLEGVELLQGTLQQYLDASLETAKKLKFYTMQIIGMFCKLSVVLITLDLSTSLLIQFCFFTVDRIVLVEISMHVSNFKAVEVRSARWPFSWNSVGEYMHIFELVAYFVKQLHEQEEVMKIVANEQRGVIEVKSATVRQWLKAVIENN
ncbi:hypothetical protein BC938DRAFT_483507 [Jimgerdemannia flammicorona]|uniref:Uncharacterized protein n=1 Tax=Jimgerdemannia flammicorona TaxID=994334 RepID=A0A433QBR9_9FUNG|nr:hypothetical protein BC938DRAFT_483507 [Jimgerdemannia flammicorona]